MTYTLIKNGTLIDGSGAEPQLDAAVLIRDNHISQVGPDSRIRLPDAEIKTIDAGGGYILPGFIDTHVHLVLEGVDIAKALVTPFSMRFYRSIDIMRRTLDAGVTSVRDAGGADLGMKQAVESGLVPGPRMQISVAVLTITGGHVDFWMPSGTQIDLLPAYPGFPDGRCDGVEGVRKKVREVLRSGAEVIKICSTGGVMSPTDHPDFTQFSPEELEVIVREASYRRGTKVMSHAQGSEGVKNALRAGVHSIEHGIFLDDEAIELFLQTGAYLVPTLYAALAVVEAGSESGIAEYAVRKAREVVESHSDSIARAHKAGVQIAMGTDAGVMPHGRNLRELSLMAEIGMTPMETIVASTKTAAECLGWEDRVGTLEAGKLADVVIARHDPLLDIRTLQNPDNILYVMKDGQAYKNHLG